MKIKMKNQFGTLKEVKVGFSWTMLLFGVFVPLIRGDWKWFPLCMLIDAATVGVAWFVLPFIYNKIYIKGLVEKGWKPVDEAAIDILRPKEIYFEV